MDLSFLYWIEVIMQIGRFAAIYLFLGLAAILICIFIVWMHTDSSCDREIELKTKATLRKNLITTTKVLSILYIISIIIVIIIPSQEVMYLLMIDEYLTIDNAQVGVDMLTESIDYIFSKIESLIK